MTRLFSSRSRFAAFDPLRSVRRIRRSLENTVRVPKDLSSITTCDAAAEIPARDVGADPERVAAVWRSVENLFRTGMHPAITFCLRIRGEIVLNRAMGWARGGGPNDPPDAPKTLAAPETPICLLSLSKALTGDAHAPAGGARPGAPHGSRWPNTFPSSRRTARRGSPFGTCSPISRAFRCCRPRWTGS